MLDLGATTFWEDFDIKWLDNAARIDELVPEGKVDVHRSYGDFCYKGFRHSFCHGWASGPTAWLSEHVLGISIVEPGCKAGARTASPGRPAMGRRYFSDAVRRDLGEARTAGGRYGEIENFGTQRGENRSLKHGHRFRGGVRAYGVARGRFPAVCGVAGPCPQSGRSESVILPKNYRENITICRWRFQIMWYICSASTASESSGRRLKPGPYSLFALPEGVPANPFIARDHLSRKALETIGPEGVN